MISMILNTYTKWNHDNNRNEQMFRWKEDEIRSENERLPSTSPPHYSDYSRFSSSNSSQTVNSISESMISNSKSVNSLNQTPYQCQNCARLKLQLLDSGIDVSRSGYESFRESISENNLQTKNLVVRKPLKKVRSQSFIDQNLKEYHLYESQI